MSRKPSISGRLLACALVLQPFQAVAAEKALPAGPDGWHRVTDGSYSSLEVPPHTAVSHDGAVVLLAIKGLKARFWSVTESRPGFPGHDPEGDMNLKTSDCDHWPPFYRVVREKMAAYSCVSGGNIDYYVSRYGNSGGVFLFASYPEKDAENFKAIISRMSQSLAQVPRKEILPQ